MPLARLERTRRNQPDVYDPKGYAERQRTEPQAYCPQCMAPSARGSLCNVCVGLDAPPAVDASWGV